MSVNSRFRVGCAVGILLSAGFVAQFWRPFWKARRACAVYDQFRSAVELSDWATAQTLLPSNPSYGELRISDGQVVDGDGAGSDWTGVVQNFRPLFLKTFGHYVMKEAWGDEVTIFFPNRVDYDYEKYGPPPEWTVRLSDGKLTRIDWNRRSE